MYTKMDKESFKEAMAEAKPQEQEESKKTEAPEEEALTAPPRKRARKKKPTDDYVLAALEKANKQEESLNAAIEVMTEGVDRCLIMANEFIEKAEEYHEHIKILQDMML